MTEALGRRLETVLTKLFLRTLSPGLWHKGDQEYPGENTYAGCDQVHPAPGILCRDVGGQDTKGYNHGTLTQLAEIKGSIQYIKTDLPEL